MINTRLYRFLRLVPLMKDLEGISEASILFASELHTHLKCKVFARDNNQNICSKLISKYVEAPLTINCGLEEFYLEIYSVYLQAETDTPLPNAHAEFKQSSLIGRFEYSFKDLISNQTTYSHEKKILMIKKEADSFSIFLIMHNELDKKSDYFRLDYKREEQYHRIAANTYKKLESRALKWLIGRKEHELTGCDRIKERKNSDQICTTKLLDEIADSAAEKTSSPVGNPIDPVWNLTSSVWNQTQVKEEKSERGTRRTISNLQGQLMKHKQNEWERHKKQIMEEHQRAKFPPGIWECLQTKFLKSTVTSIKTTSSNICQVARKHRPRAPLKPQNIGLISSNEAAEQRKGYNQIGRQCIAESGLIRPKYILQTMKKCGNSSEYQLSIKPVCNKDASKKTVAFKDKDPGSTSKIAPTQEMKENKGPHKLFALANSMQSLSTSSRSSILKYKLLKS